MLDQIIGFIAPILGFLSQKYGVIGTVGGYLLFVIAPIVSLLIELLEMAVTLTVSEKDDAFARKVRAVWSKILPILEVFPHVNVPVGAGLAKILKYVGKGIKAAMAAIAAWKQG